MHCDFDASYLLLLLRLRRPPFEVLFRRAGACLDFANPDKTMSSTKSNSGLYNVLGQKTGSEHS